jgi:hypothetical protein
VGGPLALLVAWNARDSLIFPPLLVEKKGIIWINKGTKRARINHEAKLPVRSRTKYS